MPRISDPFKAELLKLCKKHRLAESGTTEILRERIEKKLADTGKPGRPQNVVKKMLLKELKKKKLSANGSIDDLIERFKKSVKKSAGNATIAKPAYEIELNRSPFGLSAEDVKKGCKVPFGTTCSFKIGHDKIKKQIVKSTNGKVMWKTL